MGFVFLCGEARHVERPKFKRWLVLDNLFRKIRKAIGTDSFPDLVLEFVSIAFGLSISDLETEDWDRVIHALFEFYKNMGPTVDFPILRQKPSGIIEPWDYEGRSWYFWLFLLAESFGWSIEYIENLDVDDAIGLIQEIAVKEQLEREWEWLLSPDISFSFDPVTKSSKLRPLERPDWMSGVPVREIREDRFDIPEFMKPQGVIISHKDYSGKDEVVN